MSTLILICLWLLFVGSNQADAGEVITVEVSRTLPQISHVHQKRVEQLTVVRAEVAARIALLDNPSVMEAVRAEVVRCLECVEIQEQAFGRAYSLARRVGVPVRVVRQHTGVHENEVRSSIAADLGVLSRDIGESVARAYRFVQWWDRLETILQRIRDTLSPSTGKMASELCSWFDRARFRFGIPPASGVDDSKWSLNEGERK